MQQYVKTILIGLIGVTVFFLFLRFLAKPILEKFSPTTEINTASEQESTEKVSINKIAPYFDLLSLTGERVHLSDLAGSVSVITFWSTWNSDAVDQIKIFDDFLAKNKSYRKPLPVNIISINSQESQATVTNFIRRGGYDIKTLVDSTGQTSNEYGVQTLPTTFFIDSSGVVLEIFIGTMSEDMLVDNIEQILR